MMLSGNRASWLFSFLCLLAVTHGINIPFFSSFRQKPTTTTLPPPLPYQQFRDQRIINADHGNVGVPLLQPSYAGGNSPWISGTKEQFIRDQLVILHPDSPRNREAWKESGYLNPDFDPSSRKANNASSPPTTTLRTTASPSKLSTQLRARKLHRRPKQQQPEHAHVHNTPKHSPEVDPTNLNTFSSPSNFLSSQQQPIAIGNPGGGGIGGLYEMQAPMMFRDFNGEMMNPEQSPVIAPGEPMLIHGNSLLIPITAPGFPYQPRTAAIPHQSLPPEAMIQFLKSPEQEISPYTRPQVKMPFTLSRDCSASNGGSSGSKPLQFVVLPIVEPVAPLKPIFPKPSFLTSQYGQFPYIPPFNLFKQPPVTPSQGQDGSNSGAGSGQFVPILNRPAPPLPFVFVQSLPLDLIGQNLEMDVLNSAAPSSTSENRIKEIPIAAPQKLAATQPPSPPPSKPSHTPTTLVQNLPPPTRPLPLIVIEKVKTPGQPPSSPVAPAAAVVEITKQSIQKSNNNGPNTPLSTISVVQPITAPGSKPVTRQQQQEIQKAIEKLVPVAAAVLENVEQEQLKQQGRDRDISNSSPDITNANSLPIHKEESSQPIPIVVPTPTTNQLTVTGNDQERAPLRPPLRPQNNKESVGGIPPINSNQSFQFKKPDISSSEEIGVGPTTLSEVEVTEAK